MHINDHLNLAANILKDKPPRDMGFPFMKLPREIRERVYEFHMRNEDHENTCLVNKMHPRYKKSDCACPFHQREFNGQKFHVRPITLACVSKAMSQEFLRFFYHRTVSFRRLVIRVYYGYLQLS